MKHNWILKNAVDDQIVTQLQAELSVSKSVSKMLVMRNILSYDEAKVFFRPDINDLHDPFLLADMDVAVARLVKAINQREKIIVYGDYDVDGTTSVAMMTEFLRQHSAAEISYYIPDRYTEGYGLSAGFIDLCAEKTPDVVITLDCGIRAVELIKKGKELGIDFIICDHHEPGDELPPALAVLDPKRDDCEYPFDGLSGCGVGFKLIQGILISLEKKAELAWPFLDLLAISIGADIVPIDGENRILAYFGLKEINKGLRPGIKAILDNAGLKRAELTISDLVFVLAPRINAAGRIKHALAAVDLLLADSKDSAEPICNDIEGYNKERRTIDKAITAEAYAKVEADPFYKASKSTVVWGEEWHKGVIGIVASRLIEKAYKPTIVLTEKDGIATGSARSIQGIDIHRALSESDELLIKYGGHTMAAGLSIKTTQLEKFREKFESTIKKLMGSRKLESELLIDLELDFNEITAKFYRLISQFAPFGPKNMTPIFITRNVVDAGYSKIVGETKEHVKLTVKQIGGEDVYLSGIAFKHSEHFNHIKSGDPFDIAYTISLNEWNGKKTLQLEIRDIRY